MNPSNPWKNSTYRNGLPKRIRCLCSDFNRITCVALRYNLEEAYVRRSMQPCPCVCHEAPGKFTSADTPPRASDAAE